MNRVKVRKVGNSMSVTLPMHIVETLNLKESDELAVEQVGNRIVLERATTEFNEAWEAFQRVMPRYYNALKRLAEE